MFIAGRGRETGDFYRRLLPRKPDNLTLVTFNKSFFISSQAHCFPISYPAHCTQKLTRLILNLWNIIFSRLTSMAALNCFSVDYNVLRLWEIDDILLCSPVNLSHQTFQSFRCLFLPWFSKNKITLIHFSILIHFFFLQPLPSTNHWSPPPMSFSQNKSTEW